MKPTSRIAKFGPYTLDLHSGELRKFGTRVKLGEQPCRILCMLLENPGEMVSRDKLRMTLWADDTFVDFDHGLNSAVQRLRDSLSDSAARPRWVETIPRRGYRFIGPMEWHDSAAVEEVAPKADTVDLSKNAEGDPPVPLHTEDSSAREAWRTWTRVVAVAVVASAVLLTAVVLARKREHPQSAQLRPSIHSLAVLPFENLSADPNQEYFSDGMTDELITRLAQNPALRVISRTSVMQYKKVHRPLTDVARELGVDGILEGSVERSGNRIHLNAQLIYAPYERHLWAQSYDRDLNDLAALQSELARTIAHEVGVTTSSGAKTEHRILPEAHDAYLLGRYNWHAGMHATSRELRSKTMAASRDYFLKAIELQPDYAAAYAGLADFYFGEVADRALDPKLQEALKKGQQSLRQALALDDSDADAHLTMAASSYYLMWDVETAERESARAVELNPGHAQAHYVRCWILFALRRTDEALQEQRLSMEIDPRLHPSGLGEALLHARQYDAAIAELRARAGFQAEDGEVHEVLSSLYWQKKMFAESVEELAKTYAPKSAAELRDAFRRGGAEAAMKWQLAHLIKLDVQMDVSSLALARAAARAGRKEATLRYLEQAYKEHVSWLIDIGTDPDFDIVRDEPGYQSIVKKMGLPPA